MDLEKDILPHVGFEPIVRGEPKLMDARIFAAERMDLNEDLLTVPLEARFRLRRRAEHLLPQHGGPIPVTQEEVEAVRTKSTIAENGVRRVLAETFVVHAASRRMMEKSGLRPVREFAVEWPARIPGDEDGGIEYALDRAEWERQKSAEAARAYVQAQPGGQVNIECDVTDGLAGVSRS